MKRLVAALVVAAGITNLSPAPPAQAAPYSTPWNCETYPGGFDGGVITTCVYAEWARQADGQGVRLEGFHVWTSHGCGEFERTADGGQYNPVNPSWRTELGVIDYQYNFGQEPCNFDKDLSNAGREDGPMVFYFQATARVDGAADRKVFMTWRMGEAGGYDLLQSYWTTA